MLDIPNFVNPREKDPCGPFRVSIGDKDQKMQETGSDGSVEPPLVNSFETASFEAQGVNLQNGAESEYILLITPIDEGYFKATDQFTVEFPSEVDVSGVTLTGATLDSQTVS